MSKIKIGVTGSHTYENVGEIKETIFKLKQAYNDQLEIVSRGNQNGADKHIKKFALEFGIGYYEFIYDFSEYYNFKGLYTKYMAKTRVIRDKAMVKYIDYLIVFYNDDDNIENLLDYAKKFNKKVVQL